MISTVSFSFDLTSAVPRCVITDSTDYSTLGIPLDTFGAKGYGVLSFNGDITQAKNTPTNPLIDLSVNQNPGYLDLPLDLNGNVANGVYNFQYSLRLDSGGPSGPSIVGNVTGGNTFTTPYTFLSDFLTVGSSISINGVNNTVASTEIVGSNAVITLSNTVANGVNVFLRFNDNVSLQYNVTYTYSGCTQTTADANFVYDCEYGDFGTWSVSNATVLGSNEIVTSLNCIINYPSWTTADPAFNPQVFTTVLPYPALPGDENPLATGTYSVSLSQQIQQTQTSGLVVLYNNSVIKEFAVTCSGSLCGLVPCIESLRSAHATELIRNRISKYQVFVDNVALYYMEAMNYRSCGELDKYRETLTLLQAQLDASGCDCACCNDQTYYWVANNSATSVIDELLANFQYRLFSTGMGDPGNTQADVQFGAIWQNTNTGVLYRCIDATATALVWEEYYNPSTSSSVGAANGLSVSATDIVLGGTLDNDTTIGLGTRDINFSGTSGNLTFSGTSGNVIVSSTIGTALDATGTSNALNVEGTLNAISALATNDVAAFLRVDRATNNNVARNLVLSTTVTGSGVGANGLGSSIQFLAEGSALPTPFTTSSIESVVTNAATERSELRFNVNPAGPNLANSFTLKDNLSIALPFYGDGSYTGTATHSLSVDVDGNVIETAPAPKVYLALVTQTGTLDPTVTVIQNTTGETVTWSYIGVGTYNAEITNGIFSINKTSVTTSLGGYAPVSPYDGVLVGVGGQRLSSTVVQILSLGAPNRLGVQDDVALSNGVLYNATVRIEIYP